MDAGLSKTGRFVRREHIKRSSDIKKLFKTGTRVSTEGAKLFFLPNQLNINRIAFALSRGYNNAVQRNKSKRLSREVYRRYRKSLKVGYDIVFLVYPNFNSFDKRCEQFCVLCQKAGIFQ